MKVMTVWIRWFARITGAVLLGMVVTFVIGEGLPPLGRPSGAAVCVIVALLGIVVGWRWEGIGGEMIIGGMVVFYVVNYCEAGRFPGGAFALFYVPGIFYLVSHWLSSRALRGTAGGTLTLERKGHDK